MTPKAQASVWGTLIGRAGYQSLLWPQQAPCSLIWRQQLSKPQSSDRLQLGLQQVSRGDGNPGSVQSRLSQRQDLICFCSLWNQFYGLLVGLWASQSPCINFLSEAELEWRTTPHVWTRRCSWNRYTYSTIPTQSQQGRVALKEEVSVDPDK